MITDADTICLILLIKIPPIIRLRMTNVFLFSLKYNTTIFYIKSTNMTNYSNSFLIHWI